MDSSNESCLHAELTIIILNIAPQDHSDAPHWRVVFFVAALVYIVGNTIFLVWGSAKEQSWNRGLAGGQVGEDGEEEDPYAGLDD